MTHARAMILAAGRGDRMRPLTDSCPKPLLTVGGKPLMQWSIEALARGGFRELTVNTAWLGEQIERHFGTRFRLSAQPSAGSPTGLADSCAEVRIRYSHEGRDFGGALETAGGIVRALPELGGVFWVLAGDIHAPGFVFSESAVNEFSASGKLAHIWLVANPAHNPNGDFGLAPRDRGAPAHRQLALSRAETRYTYSTIGLYRRRLFAPPYCDIAAGNPAGTKAALAPLLRAAMDDAQVTAELYTGAWTDVGTPERLARLNHPSDQPT